MADLYFFFSPVRIFIGLSIEICLVRLGYIDKEAELIRDLYIRIIQITEGDIPNCFLKAVEK